MTNNDEGPDFGTLKNSQEFLEKKTLMTLKQQKYS